jgi:NAD(P)-dependent dehydrogenase (short-subunit alcohol dehydrogenase family)
VRLEGKVAVITGGAAGLGREIAQLFAREGASVVLGDLNEDGLARTVELVRADGGVADTRRCDVSDEDDVAALVAVAVSRHGRVDVMCNNAGIPAPGAGTTEVHEVSFGQWERQLHVNLSGVFYGIKHAARAMIGTGGGSIINTASASAHVVYPGWAIYAAAKSGVVGLTRGAAVDLGKYGIRVNAMTPLSGMSAAFLKGPSVSGSYEEQAAWDPGATAIPLKLDRPPGLVDHARLALFLASDESAYISGQAISLDGAQMARVGTQPAPVATEAADARSGVL